MSQEGDNELEVGRRNLAGGQKSLERREVDLVCLVEDIPT